MVALFSHNYLRAQQTSPGEVIFNAILNSAFHLTVEDGGEQTATFQSEDDYTLGVTENQGTPGIVPGYTTITMVATGNWYLNIKADDFIPNGSGTGSIPIDNLGVWCEATGNHQFGTEVTCNNTTVDNPLGLTNVDQLLIDLGTDDSGDKTDNEFVLHWEMGTMMGTMNPVNMFTQLSNGIFSLGTYVTTVELTMVEIP